MESQEYTKRNQELLAELEKYPENSQEYRDIVAKIVKNNERLVKFAANKAKRYYFSMLKSTTLNSDDLISDGYLGLLEAIKVFIKGKVDSFAGYVVSCVFNRIRDHLRKEVSHLTYSIEDDKDGDKQNLKDNLVSPVNIEEDFVDQDETDRQMAWVRKNLDQLTPLQKQVLTARYLSGETMLKTQEALAKELGCKQQNISEYTNNAIKKLRKIYYASHPEEIESEEAAIELTNEEKIKLKAELKNLIATELAPIQKKTMLCKFYSPTQKTNEQVAEEIGSTQHNVSIYLSKSCKKLCTLCDSIKDTKHLKNILELRIAENGKEF